MVMHFANLKENWIEDFAVVSWISDIETRFWIFTKLSNYFATGASLLNNYFDCSPM